MDLGGGGVKLGRMHYIGVVDKSLGHPGQGGMYATVALSSLYVLYRGVLLTRLAGCGLPTRIF